MADEYKVAQLQNKKGRRGGKGERKRETEKSVENTTVKHNYFSFLLLSLSKQAAKRA